MVDEIGKVVLPWDDIPNDFTIPTSNCDLVGVVMEKTVSNKETSINYDPNKASELMIHMKAQVEAPEECAGMFFDSWFVLGNDDKPMEINPRGLGTIQWLQCLKAANVPSTGDLDVACKSFEGSMFGGGIKDYEDKNGKRRNDLMGKYYKRGEKRAALFEGCKCAEYRGFGCGL